MSKSRKIRSHPQGQSVVEVALLLPFLLVIILALVEMGILFASYIALVNAAREGAIYASMHPELANSTLTPETGSTPGALIWDEYQNRVANEVSVSVNNQLVTGQLVNTQTPLTADRPVVGSTCTTVGCPITTTVHYQFHTFLGDASLPAFGRLGLPNTYQINYSMQMPIR